MPNMDPPTPTTSSSQPCQSVPILGSVASSLTKLPGAMATAIQVRHAESNQRLKENYQAVLRCLKPTSDISDSVELGVPTDALNVLLTFCRHSEAPRDALVRDAIHQVSSLHRASTLLGKHNRDSHVIVPRSLMVRIMRVVASALSDAQQHDTSHHSMSADSRAGASSKKRTEDQSLKSAIKVDSTINETVKDQQRPVPMRGSALRATQQMMETHTEVAPTDHQKVSGVSSREKAKKQAFAGNVSSVIPLMPSVKEEVVESKRNLTSPGSPADDQQAHVLRRPSISPCGSASKREKLSEKLEELKQRLHKARDTQSAVPPMKCEEVKPEESDGEGLSGAKPETHHGNVYLSGRPSSVPEPDVAKVSESENGQESRRKRKRRRRSRTPILPDVPLDPSRRNPTQACQHNATIPTPSWPPQYPMQPSLHAAPAQRFPYLRPGFGPNERLFGRITQLIHDSSGYIASDSIDGQILFERCHWYPRQGDLVEFSFAHHSAGYPLAVDMRCIESLVDLHKSSSAAGLHQPYKPAYGELKIAHDFMRRHACRTHEECYTHSSMLGGRDPWASRVGRFKFGDDCRAQEELARVLETIWLAQDMHSKLYLTEHPSDVYAFVEDIDVEGSRNSGTPTLMRPDQADFELLKWRANVLRTMFPTASFRCMLYASSGWYSGSELYKESYHLIWPDILVDKDKAVRVRLATVEYFESHSQITGHPLSHMLQYAAAVNEFNTWDRIFDATTTRPKVGLRMPFCDKRSLHPGNDRVWLDEHRPVIPVGELGFEFARVGGDQEVCTRVFLTEPAQKRQPWQWALFGMCRRPQGARQVYFRPPCLKCPPPVRTTKRNSSRKPGSGTSANNRATSKMAKRIGKTKQAHAVAHALPRPEPVPIVTSAENALDAATSDLSSMQNPHLQWRPGWNQWSRDALGQREDVLAMHEIKTQHGSIDPVVETKETCPGTTRIFPNGSRSEFAEALREALQQRLCDQSPQRREISGGVQFFFAGLGNINFYDKSTNIVIQGQDVAKLLQLVECWTNPLSDPYV